MFVKIHSSYRNVIAVCDEDLLGKIFEEGKLQINVKENFFKGETVTPEQLRNILHEGRTEDSTFNIVGKESINLALETGLIEESGITTIQGVPVALVLM